MTEGSDQAACPKDALAVQALKQAGPYTVRKISRSHPAQLGKVSVQVFSCPWEQPAIPQFWSPRVR